MLQSEVHQLNRYYVFDIFIIEMSDSEDAFESADEGAEEKKETEQKQNVVTPPVKAAAKKTSPQATAGWQF